MTHSVGDVISLEGTTTPTEVVNDYSVVERDNPRRPAVYASGDLYTFLSTTRETDFDFNFFDFFLPVNGGPPPHYHPFEDEIWHVTDGEFQFNLGNQGNLGIVVPEGTTVLGPINRIHGYRNLDSTASVIGTTPGARTLSMTVPGALDLFFESVAQPVNDRDQLIPAPEAPTPEDFVNLAKFSARTEAGITLLSLDPDYQPPEGTLDYILVLPDDASSEVVEQAIELNKLDDFSVWTTSEQAGLPKRPTFTGDFGIEYTSLVSLEESANKFAYNQFELTSDASDTKDFAAPVTSEEHQLFYVNEGRLTLEINGEVKIAEQDTYVHIAPGNEYAIANFSEETVEALSISIPEIDELDLTAELFPSPFVNESGKTNHGSEEDDEIVVNERERAFGYSGDDLLIAGSNSELYGGDGDDLLNITSSGNNRLYGNAGRDRFEIANGKLPDTVPVEYPEGTNELLPEGVFLPELVDTRNTIMDFELGVDQIYISGLEEISSFEDLQLLPVFGDFGSTSIVAEFNEDGIEKEISLANVAGIAFNELSADDFVFA